jgi:hypothetical protein
VDRGDIYAEDDVNQNTYLDWSEDAVGFVCGGHTSLVISGSTVISSSLNLSASGFYGDGSGLSNISATVSPAGSNAQIQFNDNGSTGAAAQLYWSEANNRLGIGTNNPSKVLDIEHADSAMIQVNATNHRSYAVGSDSYGFIVHDNTTGGTAGYRFVISDQTDYLGYVGIGDGVGIAASAHPKALLHLSSSDDQALLRVDTTGGSAATTVLFATGSNRVGIGTATPASTFEISGSQAGNYTQTAGNITFNETHYVVDYTGNGNATFTLPATSGVTGRQYHILSHAQGGLDKLTITGSGGPFQGVYLGGDVNSVTIDGNTPQSITVLSTGTNWFVLHDGRSE